MSKKNLKKVNAKRQLRKISRDLRNKSKIRVLVTAGPTRAYLDDVRFISNYSSGKLGYELCKELHKVFSVALVAGKTSQPFGELGLERLVEIETNQEMRTEVLAACRSFKPDWVILSAAVLDFEPAKILKGKVSSKKSSWVVRLKPAPKIIDEVRRKFPDVNILGFKLEPKFKSEAATLKLGREILKKKNLQAVLVNYLSEIKKEKHIGYLVTSDTFWRFENKKQISKGVSRLLILKGSGAG